MTRCKRPEVAGKCLIGPVAHLALLCSSRWSPRASSSARNRGLYGGVSLREAEDSGSDRQGVLCFLQPQVQALTLLRIEVVSRQYGTHCGDQIERRCMAHPQDHWAANVTSSFCSICQCSAVAAPIVVSHAGHMYPEPSWNVSSTAFETRR